MAVGYSVSGEMVLHSGMANAGFATGIALEAATGVMTGGVWDVMAPLQVNRVQVVVRVAFDYDTLTTEGVVSFFKRVTYDSDTDRVLIGRVRLLDEAAVGDRLYADVDPVKCVPGEQIVADITTQAAGGTEVGDFLPEVVVTPVPEADGNMPKMVEAAVTA